MNSTVLNFKRIGRVKFLAYTHITYALLALIFYLTYSLDDIKFSSLETLYWQNPVISTLLMLLIFLPLKFLAQRYKDAGLSGWWALVGVIPQSYFMLYLLMGLFRGEAYENRHGEVPNKAGIALQLMGYVPLVFIILAQFIIAFFFIKNF